MKKKKKKQRVEKNAKIGGRGNRTERIFVETVFHRNRQDQGIIGENERPCCFPCEETGSLR
jgi:hypothetical protein